MSPEFSLVGAVREESRYCKTYHQSCMEQGKSGGFESEKYSMFPHFAQKKGANCDRPTGSQDVEVIEEVARK